MRKKKRRMMNNDDINNNIYKMMMVSTKCMATCPWLATLRKTPFA